MYSAKGGLVDLNAVMILDNNNALFLPLNEDWMHNLACVLSNFGIVGGKVSNDALQQVYDGDRIYTFSLSIPHVYVYVEHLFQTVDNKSTFYYLFS